MMESEQLKIDFVQLLKDTLKIIEEEEGE